MNLRYLPQARTEAREAALWYDHQQAGLGDRFVAALLEAEAAVMAEPFLGRELDPPIRKWNLVHFPYALVYEVEATEVVVHAVMHLHREPGCWQGRT